MELELLLRLRESEHVTWSGHRRAPLDGPHEIFGHDRFLLYMSSLDHAKTMRSIELYGTAVAPAVRAEVARRAVAAPARL